MKLTYKYILLTLILIVTSSFFAYSQSSQKFIVALDAGHGDHDFGAVYHGHIEKNITLAIALKVGKILEKNPNIDVVYTKKTDVFVDLIERANIANRANANIFVSIHCNANKNNDANGSETYVMGLSKNASNLEAAKKENAVVTLEKDYKKKYEGFNPNEPESIIGMTLMQEEYLENSIALAGKVQENFTTLIEQKDRGVKQAPFMVLHKAYMPRVLIETGFISNKEEGARLDSEEGQMETATAIAKAIVSYKNEFFGADKNEPQIEKPTRYIPKEQPKPIEVVKETPKTTNIVVDDQPVVNDKELIYKVQLSASTKKISTISSNFKGLTNITSNYNNNLYKYYYGQTNSFEESKKLLVEAKSKGYSSAFIIAIKEGKTISVTDALKQ